jgi:polar amino acid transport system permease protein
LLRLQHALAATLVCLVSLGAQAAPPDTASAPSRVYVVGTDASYAPFESQNEQGKIVGFDIDIVRAAAARAGVEVRIVNTPWEGIFNALTQGDRDIVVSAVSITPERRASMAFSDPYFDARQLIAVAQASPVRKLADLKGLKVGVQTGTSGDEVVSKLLGKTSSDIKRFESTPLALKELEAGGVDAVVADNGVVINYVAHNAGGHFKTVADPSFSTEKYGMALRKGDNALRLRLNQGLAALRADGSYDRIYANYFGAQALAAEAQAASAAALETGPADPASGLHWEILAGYGPLFAHGLLVTLELTAVAIAVGLGLGVVFGLVSSSADAPPPVDALARVLLVAARGLTRAYVTFFRGTPLFVQILLVHFALMPALINADHGLLLSGAAAREFRQAHGAFLSGCVALSLNAGAYISEIFRAGIQSIHRGQTQAAYSVGLTHAQAMRHVVLPQAFRRMVPALVNEGVTLIKDSSLVSAIGLAELALAARTVAGAYSRYWEPYLAISAIYLVLTLLLSTLAKRLEAPAHLRGR